MLPSGSVTFVFTDIEGSTRLLRGLGDGYVAVLDRHRSVLRQAWNGHGGVEVSTEGDGCFVAFDTADGALAACASAQRGIGEVRWSDGIDLRVRMGVHTGIAFPRGNDYIALAVQSTSSGGFVASPWTSMRSTSSSSNGPHGQRQSCARCTACPLYPSDAADE